MHQRRRSRPTAAATMDVMRPSQAFAAPVMSPLNDARRWLRPVLFTLLGAAALVTLLGVTAMHP